MISNDNRYQPRKGLHGILYLLLAAAAGTVWQQAATAQQVGWEEVAAQTVSMPDRRIRYAEDSRHQYGELRLPGGPAPHPLAIVLHGGCWGSNYGHDYMDGLSARLTRAGSTHGRKPSRISSAIGDLGTSTAGLTSNSSPAKYAAPST